MEALLDKLFKTMKERGIKIPALAKQLDLPPDRIYGWKKYGKIAKAGDNEIIQKWINNQNIEADPGKPDLYDQVLIGVVASRVAKLEANAFGGKAEDYMKQIVEDTNLLYEQQKRK